MEAESVLELFNYCWFKETIFKTTNPQTNLDADPEIEIQNSENFNLEKKKKKKNRGVMSKSLSELEFEEVKGFMDLGFVFSDEDKESSELASIIPGLGKKEEMDDNAKITPARPYLSETWEWLDLREKKEKPLMNWNFPALSNKTNMKHNLKSWAHTVAIVSAVK